MSNACLPSAAVERRASPRDAVVLARRRVGIGCAAALAARARRRNGIAFGRRDQFLADPALVAAEIQHRRRVGDAGVRAARVAVRDQPVVEVVLRLRVDLVAEVDVLALRRVLRVELLGDLGEDRRLTAAVVAHDHHVLEAGDDRLLGDLGRASGRRLRCSARWCRAGRRWRGSACRRSAGITIALPSLSAMAFAVARAIRVWPPLTFCGPRCSVPPV